VVKDPSCRIETENSAILFDGKDVSYKKYIYIMLNKPSGVLSASEDKSVETVVDIVKKDFDRSGLFPVGRLDKTSTGLLIITDDGNFAHNVISPKKDIEKQYMVVLDGELTDENAKKLEKGVTLADGYECKKCIVNIDKDDKKVAYVTITEGKYHQIKRMFGVVNLGVNELHRQRIGKLWLDETLSQGEYREINAQELEKIFIN
jgi:16S rRNA pseudouridine516 synthase